jgi:CO/xanthine dehydrogenase FAD-binding subunit
VSVFTPTSLDDALEAIAAHPGALLLAGGTDAMVEINGGHRRPPSTVVALGRVAELRTWSHDPSTATVRIGGAVTYAELMEPPLADWLPALAQAARTVGSPQIRQVATIGGNVATSSPAGDGLPVIAALDGVVHLRGATVSRDVPFSAFATGPKRTVIEPGEVIVAVSVPVLDGWQGFAKVGVRNAMVISTVGACLAVDVPGASVRIALGSVGPTIIRCRDAEQLAAASVDFAAGSVADADVAAFAEACREAARPIDDHRSTAAYRRHAVGVLAARLLRRAFPDG